MLKKGHFLLKLLREVKKRMCRHHILLLCGGDGLAFIVVENILSVRALAGKIEHNFS
jgi:hypothetical protein